MRRAGAKTTLGFVIASVVVHGVAGVGLRLAPKRSLAAVQSERVAARPAPIEVDFGQPQPAPLEADAGGAVDPRAAEQAREVRRERERERVRREREREPERPPEPERFATPELVVVQPPPEARNRASVQQSQSNNQRSNDANYLAERDNNVAEETRAAVRGTQEDSANPQHGATQQRAPGTGAGSEDVHDGSRDRQGADFAQSQSHVGGRRSATRTREGAQATAVEAVAANAGHAGAQGAPGATEPTPPTQTQTRQVFSSNEGVWGQYAIAPVGAAAAGQNGANGNGGTGSSSAAARVGIAGRGAAGAIAALSPASADYARTFGAAVEQERRLARERRTQARGESPTESWQQLRAGMENYVTAVRVGNQTALRTAASPFATYLSQMHHRIHRLFADGFLSSLDASGPENPLNDPRLQSTVEIVLERDGRVARVGIVRTSGSTMFDVAAMNSVRRSAPFGAAPDAIRSADGKVYIHWGFYRSERQCGTFNAEPFVLSAPNSGGSRERTTIIVPRVGRDR